MNVWHFLLAVLGWALIVIGLVDAFETIVLPRTVSRKFRLTKVFYLFNRWLYERVGNMKPSSIRQRMLVSFAPLSLFVLVVLWGSLIVVGYSCIAAGLGLGFRDHAPTNFANRVYFSATTFLTFGFGDFVPHTETGKWLAVAEAGTGFIFLALVIGYVPTFYAAFSRREQTILLLDSKAGSDPSACEILRRHAEAGCLEELVVLLKDWEAFGAQLLENFLSYPMLAFYRSQHDDQSWLNSLTAIMDACAVCMTLYPDDDPIAKRMRFQAKATFAMARHVIVDFSYVLQSDPMQCKERMPDAKLAILIKLVAQAGLDLKNDPDSLDALCETRHLYDPFVGGLSKRLKMDLPEWVPAKHLPDNWETSAWDGTHF